MHTSIVQSEPSDIAEIFNLYQAAANFQRSKKTVVVWPDFDPALVENEIAKAAV